MIVGGQRKKPSVAKTTKEEPELPAAEANDQSIQTFIDSRDYSGAATFIEFLKDQLNQPYTKEMALWHGYSLFHLGNYEEAISVYKKLLEQDPDDTVLNLYIASCEFYLRDYTEAKAYADKGPSCDFRTRLYFHIAHQTNDENLLYQSHSQLVGTLENQLSLAAIHYMRSHYQDAIEVYQKLLLEHPDYLALNVYIAMCQFKLDQFEEANESVDNYLSINSDSAVALNLKSCAYLRLFDAQTAESQLLQIRKFSSATYAFVDSLIDHNLCIFHDGADGFTTLPKLVGVIPESKFNLATLYMRESNAAEAYNILQDFQPLDVTESYLKAAVDLAYGQLNADPTPIEESNTTFQDIGEMEGVRDTIPGREALTTTKFIQGEYDQALKVLQTIEQFVGDTDEFNYNKAMSLAALARWPEAERHFLLVKNPAYTREIYYMSWLCKCYIMNKKGEQAWNLYTESTNTEDAKTLLQIISTDCFTQGLYYYAMKAYDVLAKFDLEPTNKEGLIASAVAVFRNILSRKETPDHLFELRDILASEPGAEQVLQTIENYIETSGEFDTSMY